MLSRPPRNEALEGSRDSIEHRRTIARARAVRDNLDATRLVG